ncbi:Uncharacterized protein APZ42_031845 [Daphnia magna]|uniref:Uncharacterized protein n=1 Tax=Daphnia magna TaxID=35525 RepID=A0A164MHH8_9CRUS|nr:Uncharacterized protein APZ42_031845 [Daphnia magna]
MGKTPNWSGNLTIISFPQKSISQVSIFQTTTNALYAMLAKNVTL